MDPIESFASPTASAAGAPQTRTGPGLVTLPFARHGGLIFLPVRVNGGAPLRFILETGAGPCVIDLAAARRLGLDLGDRNVVSGAGAGSAEMAIVRGAALRLGRVQVRDPQLIATSLRELGAYTGEHIDGMLGNDFIRRFAVEIDHARRSLTLHEPALFAPRHGAPAVALESSGGHLFVRAAMAVGSAPEVEGRFAVDTGAGATLALTSPFVRRHGLLDHVGRTHVVPVRGLVADMRQPLARATHLRIGGASIAAPVAIFSADEHGAFANADVAGYIGNGIWERFTMTLDVPHGRLLLEPNEHFDRPDVHDASGLVLQAEGPDLRTYRVRHVLAHTPSAESGLRDGDELAEIDGTSVRALTLSDVRERLKRAGRPVGLVVRRDGATRQVRLALRELV